MSTEIYFVSREREVDSGYIDIRLEGWDIFNIPYNYVLELQDLKANANKNEIKKIVLEDKEQLATYKKECVGKCEI